METDSTPTFFWILALCFLAFHALFAISETAVVTLNDNKLKNMAASGQKRARVLVLMTKQPTRFLTTIQTGLTLTGLCFYICAFGGLRRFLLIPLQKVLQAAGQTSAALIAAGIAATVLAVLAIGFILLLLGQLVPRRIAMEYSESIAFATAPVLHLFFILLYPFTAFLNVCVKWIVRVFGIKNAAKPENVTEEEIRMMVDAGNETGSIEETEKEMINNIFEFDDKTVSEVMTHRTELAALDQYTTVLDAIQVFVESGHSRLPVYEEDIDTITGFLYAKDLLKLAGNSEAMENVINVYTRAAMFVPESTRCADLMKAFKENKVQIAIIVDEYGGTSGVVTMEDLLETIVGSIQDEYDHEEAESSQISDNCYTLDGSLSLDEAERILKVPFASEEESEEYDTLSGMLIHLLDRIPSSWEHPVITVGNITFTVLEMEDRMMAKIKAEISPSLSSEDN